MPPERQHPHPLAGIFALITSRGAHLVVGAIVVCAAVFSAIDATKTRPSDGTVWLLGRPDLEVLDVVSRQDSQNNPLQRGDIIVGLGRSIVDSPQAAARELRRYGPGDVVNYLIRRDGLQFPVAVPLTSTRVDLRDYSVNVVLALIYLVIGFAVYLRSGNEREASLFYLLCLLFGLYFVTDLQGASYFLGAIIAQNIGVFARFMLPAVFLHFFLVFPRKKLTLTRHPFLAPLLYVVPLMFYVRFTLDQFVGSQGARIHAASWLVLGLYYLCGLAALLHGYFSYRDPLMRQRVRILTVGTLAAVIPFLVVKIGLEELSFQTGLSRLGVVPLAAIPISFGYCVARYQVLQIDLLLKRHLSYALLAGLIWIGYLGAAWQLGVKVLDLLPTANTLAMAGATLAVAAGLWPLRARLQQALDRRFYHSRDNLAALIEEFSKEIPRLIQRDALLNFTGRRLQEVLELPSIAVYLADAQGEAAAFSLAGLIHDDGRPRRDGEPAAESRTLRYPTSLQLPGLARHLGDNPEPVWADTSLGEVLDDRQAITREQAELLTRGRELRFLIDHGIQLLIPMLTQNRLVGLAALPRRPGDHEYEVHELRLLTIVAGQVALQMENSRLYEEEVAKQKLEEEMAMARRIQARLLPRQLPALAGVEIQAVNISSKQVSGDYYDLVEREDGRLAIIIADVSGKGMPASILASNLQAAIRAQCDTCESPGLVLERINRQIHASTDPQHFATVFLAMFDPATRELVYSSGGHNAPVIMRRDGTSELLEEGGLPLGAFDFGSYDEGRTRLEAGDLLFLYTDGLTEARGPDGEEDYGESRLGDVLQREREGTMEEIFARVTEDLRSFSGRTEADDDITMVGLKITAADVAALLGAETARAERTAGGRGA